MLMAAFLYWAFREVDPASLWATIKGLPVFWIAAIVLTTLCTLALRAWRWAALMRPFAPHVSVLDASLALSICYTSNVAIPRSGEFLRAVSLRWTRGVNVSSTLATVVVERILDMIWLIIFLGISLLIVRSRLEAVFPGLGMLILVALVGCLGALLFLGLVSIYRERALDYIRPLLERLSPRLAGKVTELLETFLHGLQSLHSPTAYLEIVVSSILLNLGYTLIVYESFIGFQFTSSYGLGLGPALVIMVISSIGVIFPTPGATGSYHAFFSKALVHLFDVPPNPALACATAVHAVATLTYMAIGFPALIWQRRLHKREQIEREEEERES